MVDLQLYTFKLSPPRKENKNDGGSKGPLAKQGQFEASAFRDLRERTKRADKIGEGIRSLKLSNVWVFVQLIRRRRRTKNQLYQNPNIA